MVCVHYYNIREIIFTSLEILCTPLTHFSFLSNPWRQLNFLLSPQFCLSQHTVETIQYIMAPIVPHPHQHLVLSVFGVFGYSNRCIMISHYCFNFLDDVIWYTLDILKIQSN